MADPVQRYLDSLSNPDDATIAALEPVLADDVRAAGMFGAGIGKEAVLAPEVERNFDPRRRGNAILVEVDALVGNGPTGRVNMRRQT